MKQKTIARSVSLQGVGIHTGVEATVCLKPAEPDRGIVFVRTDLPGSPKIPARVEYYVRKLRRSAVQKGDAEVQTIEHCLSALHGLGIDNVEIEINGPEFPALDGSALPYVQAIKEAGILEQEKEKEVIRLSTPVSVSEKDASIVAIPAESGLTISYTLNYNVPYLKAQHYTFHMTPDSYEQETLV